MLNCRKLSVATFATITVCLILVAEFALQTDAQPHLQVPAPASALPEYTDVEGYAVLSALLGREHSPNAPVLRISAETDSGLEVNSFQSCKNIPIEFKTAADNFAWENIHPWKLQKQFNLKFEYEIRDPRQKDPKPPVLPGEQPLEVPQHHIVVVSAVGFNPARDRAILYFAGGAGTEASGSYYLLVKNKYGWALAEAFPVCEWMTQEMKSAPARRSL